MSPQLHLVTVASDERQMWRLKETCARHHVPLHVLHKDPWTGFVDKITTVAEYLHTLPDDDTLVCFVDAYDVLCLSNVEEIVAKFLATNCRILLSAELNCYPERYQLLYNYVYQELEPVVRPSTQFLYVNSGGYIGYKKDLLHLLEWRSVEDIRMICRDGGDQVYFAEYFLEHVLLETIPSPSIQLDWNQEIFQSMYRVRFTEFSWYKGEGNVGGEKVERVRFTNNVLGTTPCFVHFNGLNANDFRVVSIDSPRTCENIMNVFLVREHSGCDASLNYTQEFYKTIDGVAIMEIDQKKGVPPTGAVPDPLP